MYQFKIKEQEDGGYKFELEGIRMIIDEYVVKDGKHILTHPEKAIAYFMIENNIYGISNDPLKSDSAEAFYDAIIKQYQLFMAYQRPGTNNSDLNSRKHTA